MVMPEAARRWTRDMVLALPDDRNRYELIDGELIVTPSPTPRHQMVLVELVSRFLPYLREAGSGQLLTSPADLALGEEEILQPDFFVIPRVAAGALTAWGQVTTLLLAVEIISPASARWDRGLKRRRYQRPGVPEYWIVDPDARVVERWRPTDMRPEILDSEIEWRPDPETAPLRIDLALLFAEVLGSP